MLPIEIQMQIHVTAAAHQRELAEAFAALRARLLPSPDPIRDDGLRNVAMHVGTSGGGYPLSYDPTDAWLAAHLLGVSTLPPNDDPR